MEEPSPAPRCRPPPATTMAVVPGSKMAAPSPPPNKMAPGRCPVRGRLASGHLPAERGLAPARDQVLTA